MMDSLQSLALANHVDVVLFLFVNNVTFCSLFCNLQPKYPRQRSIKRGPWKHASKESVSLSYINYLERVAETRPPSSLLRTKRCVLVSKLQVRLQSLVAHSTVSEAMFACKNTRQLIGVRINCRVEPTTLW